MEGYGRQTVKRHGFLMWFASKGRISRNQDESSRPQPVKIDASLKPSESTGTVWSLPLFCRVNMWSRAFEFSVFLRKGGHLFMTLHLNKSCEWFRVFTLKSRKQWSILTISVQVARTQRAAPNDFRPNRMIKAQSARWSAGKGEGNQDLLLDL